MEQARRCAKCDEHSAGAGGILCPECTSSLSHVLGDYWRDHPASPANEPAEGTVDAEPSEFGQQDGRADGAQGW